MVEMVVYLKRVNPRIITVERKHVDVQIPIKSEVYVKLLELLSTPTERVKQRNHLKTLLLNIDEKGYVVDFKSKFLELQKKEKEAHGES